MSILYKNKCNLPIVYSPTFIITNVNLHPLQLSLSFNQLSYLSPDAARDISSTLENLELSFGLHHGYSRFPSEFIKPLHKLLWLALDNNAIGPSIEPETALYNLGELQYLNLESNRLKHLPANLLHQNVHKKLLGKWFQFEVKYVN